MNILKWLLSQNCVNSDPNHIYQMAEIYIFWLNCVHSNKSFTKIMNYTVNDGMSWKFFNDVEKL